MSSSAQYCLKSLTLCEESLKAHNNNIAHERAVAIHDLLQNNYFKPHLANEKNDDKNIADGLFHLKLELKDAQHLIFHIFDAHAHDCENNHEIMVFILSIRPLKRIIKDYYDICQSYFDAVKRLPPPQIETLDMARRSIHIEGANILQQRLKNKITLNEITAKRLFTLIYILHYHDI